tara:strand:+ start:209 stop:328 length:120 start_codon:yes stop_codon:yes gene_type:complete
MHIARQTLIISTVGQKENVQKIVFVAFLCLLWSFLPKVF